MSVNWDNVEAPPPEDENEEEEGGSSVLATVIFAVLAIAGLVAGAAFLNVTLLGKRFKQRAIEACDGPACVLEIRTTHDDCFADRMVFAMPASMDAFQTPPSSNTLAFLTVDYDDYLVCAGVKDAP